MLIRDFGLFCKTFQPFLSLTFISNTFQNYSFWAFRLIFSFSEHLFKEYSKPFVDFGIHGIQLLECMLLLLVVHLQQWSISHRF